MAGVLKKKYYHDRKKRIDFKYRLNRRTSEIKKIIEKFFKDYSNLSILDIGTADGLMLSKLNSIFSFKNAVGIDMSKELIKANKDKNIRLELGNAEKLRFKEKTFDIITAAAVIEHLDNPNNMLKECYRVLKNNGILILTTPNPFHENIADKIKYLKGEQHTETLTIEKLRKMLEQNKFDIVYSKYFMFFPFFKVPFENSIEHIIRKIRLGKLMTNQLIVGRK